MLHLDKSPPIRHLDCPTSFLKATCDILAKKENFFFSMEFTIVIQVWTKKYGPLNLPMEM